MNSFKFKSLASLLLIGTTFASSAIAGEFNTWAYAKGKNAQHDVVVSFSGDGTEQEAMVDLNVPKGAILVKSEVLVAGSVCVGLDNNSYIRAVPPSGAGNALPTKETDYCRFTFDLSKASARGNKLKLTEKFTECSSPGSEIKSCELQAYDVSEKK